MVVGCRVESVATGASDTGANDGEIDGLALGIVEGDFVGEIVGFGEGKSDGVMLGDSVGLQFGVFEGFKDIVGCIDMDGR